jgi:hypothetical protein
MGAARWICLGLLAAALAACDKVPLVDINARFALADAVWFEAEQTLFFFYRVEADQPLGTHPSVELTWRTDEAEQPWGPISQMTPVHTHTPVDCGPRALCGSTSLHVAGLPRQVGLRLRYHREGAVTLDPLTTSLHVVNAGPAHANRSLLVYGVFDEANLHVQWRSRHVFPNLRNHEVQDLGLRRFFAVFGPRHGDPGPLPLDNPYGYGVWPSCPEALAPLGWEPVATDERAVFHPPALPLDASTSKGVCADATVKDATGVFGAAAVARKNPEVRPAFPVLRSPVRTNTPIGFVLRICNRTISDVHLEMQVQRLLLEGAPEICIDDWSKPGFAGTLATRFKGAFDAVRPQGNDMVLVLALHHDDRSGQLGAVLEEALFQVLPAERDKSSPRVSGAFVFDSLGYTVGTSQLRRVVLWCPARIDIDDLDLVPATSEMSCPLQPDVPDLQLGPFRFNNLPILPSRPQYLTFLEKYSEGQAGKMTALTFRAPERTPLSENYPAGDFGVVTFFNGETISAAAADRFSWCPPDEGGFNPVVFRTQVLPDPIPLEMLPEFHATFPQPSYSLGLFWEFPYLLRLEYETVVAGAASAYGLSVPFGVGTPNEAYYGAQAWETGEFPLAERLLQCRRFCDHPVFDSASVYNVTTPFDPVFRTQCYRPVFPVHPTGGFPLDP